MAGEPTLIDLFADHAGTRSRSLFISHRPTGEAIDYQRAWVLARDLSCFLKKVGIRTGERIALFTQNHWIFLPLLAACGHRRVVLMPVNPELHEREVRTILDHASPALVITDPEDSMPVVQKARTHMSTEELLGRSSGCADRELDPTDSNAEDVMLLMYTSGTTGSAKGVMLTWQNLFTMARAIRERYKIVPEDVFLCVLPAHHMHTVMLSGLVPLVAGASVVCARVFSLGASFYWDHVSENRVTICPVTPSIMAILMRQSEGGYDGDIDSVRFAFCGGAPLPAPLWKSFEERFGFPVYQGYGLSETTTWVTSSPPGPREYESVGVPIASEVRIDVAGTGTADSRSGEVVVRGPTVMVGYFSHTPAADDDLTEDGWLRTGDVGYLDGDGHLFIVGRSKEIVIRGGVNINPGDVDLVIETHEAVAECKTIGVPDDIYGERLVTAYIPEPAVPEISPWHLRLWAIKELSKEKCPDTFIRMGWMPMGTTGKVSIGLLRSIVMGEAASAIMEALTVSKRTAHEPSDPEGMRNLIQRSLLEGSPLEFLCYWECRGQRDIEEDDMLVLARLRDYLHGADIVDGISGRLTLIFQDVHADVKGFDMERGSDYFSSVAEASASLGFMAVYASELLDDTGLCCDEVSLLEKEAVTRAYPDCLFLSFSSPEADHLLPCLLKLYLNIGP